MSDYLWDKTGEPDAEVERLERALGALRHRPRPLELPADAVPETRRPWHFDDVQRFRSSRLFAPAGLAAAAALLLAFLLGAAALLRPRLANEGGVASRVPGQAEEPRRPAGQETESTNGTTERTAAAGRTEHEEAAVKDFMPAPRRVRDGSPAAASRRRQEAAPSAPEVARADEGFVLEAVRAAGDAPMLIESTRLAAKEQLVYALRLTGEKLRDVRLRTQGSDGEKPAPEERKRTR